MLAEPQASEMPADSHLSLSVHKRLHCTLQNASSSQVLWDAS